MSKILILSLTAACEHLAIIEPKTNICGDRLVLVPTRDLMGLPRTNYAYQYVGEPPFGHGHNSNNCPRRPRLPPNPRGRGPCSAGCGLRAASGVVERAHSLRAHAVIHTTADLHLGAYADENCCGLIAMDTRFIIIIENTKSTINRNMRTFLLKIPHGMGMIRVVW